MQQYAHYNPNDGFIFCITDSDSMDYIIPITDAQYNAYLESPDTWRVNLETLKLYQVDAPNPGNSTETPPVLTTESRLSALEENDATQYETIGTILEDILPGLN